MSAKLNQILSGTTWILGLSAMGAITGRVNSDLVGRFLEKHISSSGVLVAGELAFGALALREIASLVIPSDAALPVSDSIMWVFFFAASPTMQAHLQRSLRGLDAMLPGGKKSVPLASDTAAANPQVRREVLPSGQPSAPQASGMPPAANEAFAGVSAAKAGYQRFLSQEEQIANYAGQLGYGAATGNMNIGPLSGY